MSLMSAAHPTQNLSLHAANSHVSAPPAPLSTTTAPAPAPAPASTTQTQAPAPAPPAPRKRGRPPGRPRIYFGANEQTGDPGGSAYADQQPSVNEIIPKVWILSDFTLAAAQCIAKQVLEKGDKVVLGFKPNGKQSQEVLQAAEDLVVKWGKSNCVVMELDVR